jgi:hypothetical protein
VIRSQGFELSNSHLAEDRDLYGISPGVIAVFMAFVTVFLPSGLVPVPAEYLSYTVYFVMVYSPLWVYATDFSYLGFAGYTGFFIFNPSYIAQQAVLSAFNLLFLWCIVRYYQGRTSKKTVIAVGLLSLVPPAVMPLVISFGSHLLYRGPLPIQFAVGMLLLIRVRGPIEVLPDEKD